MNRMAKICLTAFALLFSVCALAESSNIGVINIQKIMQASPEVKAMREKLENEFKPRQQKLLNLSQEYKANVERLKRDTAIMTKSQKDELERKVVQQKRDLERQGQDYQQDLNMAQNQSMEKFFNKVKKVVNKIAAKKGYAVVLQKDSVPYNSPEVDITASVLDALK